MHSIVQEVRESSEEGQMESGVISSYTYDNLEDYSNYSMEWNWVEGTRNVC